MSATIRTATPADLPALLRFEQGVIEAERAFDPTIREDQVHYYDIASMIAADTVRFVVAERGGETVGCGYARVERSEPFRRHSMHGYLGLMYVEPAHRGCGIIGLVIDALTFWCRGQGLTELSLEVYSRNEAAIAAYAKAGFVGHQLQMRRAIARG